MPSPTLYCRQSLNFKKLVSELGGKYDGAEDFINSRVKELRAWNTRRRDTFLYIFMLRIQFSH